MKRVLVFLSVLISAASLAQEPVLVDSAGFDDIIDGKKVVLYTISGGGLTMQVTNFGGRVVSLFVPDRDGNIVDVVLGHNTLDEYVNYKKERFLGAVVGPVANRITDAQYTWKGTTYHLARNYGTVTLHGGFKGLDFQVWDVEEVTANSIT